MKDERDSRYVPKEMAYTLTSYWELQQWFHKINLEFFLSMHNFP